MKSSFTNLFSTLVQMAGVGLVLFCQATAQTFTTLYTFTALSGTPFTNSDGAYPYGLIASGNVLYGTASQGGSSAYGAVFRINTDGTGFTNLYNFTAAQTNSSGVYTNSDGANPRAGLILSGNVLYGTAVYGGNWGNGTLFAINIDGTGFTTLHHFTLGSNGSYGTNSDGINPVAGLVLAGNTLYGTASGGGASGNGTVFALNSDGSSFTTLHSFTAVSGLFFTNNDGVAPGGRLVSSSNVLYGTAAYGGNSANGTVFAMNTNGTGFRVLHSFTATDKFTGANGDGAYPNGLLLSGSTLYGTAAVGGRSDNGTVFKVKTDGTGFTVLHSFTATDSFPYTNIDGAYPVCALISSSANTLYGSALYGGASANGTVFSVSTDGTAFANLYDFSATLPGNINSDGAYPNGLLLSGNTLFGTAISGGTSADGTVFSLSLPPSAALLTIIPSGGNVILTWPADPAGFNLQSATDLVSPTWTAVSPVPVLVNGQNVVTNSISGTKQFFRLSQ